MLPSVHQEALQHKFRVGMRIIHRCLSVPASNLFSLVKERPLESYNDIFYYDTLSINRPGEEIKTKKVGVGHFCKLKRVQRMIADHESYLMRWINLIEINPR
jgi:hypothetical protein